MALNASGPISLIGTTAGQSIQIELGGNGSTQMGLTDSTVRTLAGVASGAITMPGDFYGKSNQYNFTISSNQSNYDLRSAAVAAGWNQTSKLAVTINSGVYVYSTSTGSAALTVSGSFPGGVTLVNNGYILGQGGNGGNGGNAGYGQYGYAGSPGGLALSVSSAISITNNGVIGGGGGGGGGGGSNSGGDCQAGWAGGGGGGGQTGLNNSSGGSPGSGNNGQSSTFPSAGGSGTSAGPGGGGQRGASPNGAAVGGYGGSGGGWGSAGSTGGSGGGVYGGWAGGSGGSAGAATSGSATYITWLATGTRYGTIG